MSRFIVFSPHASSAAMTPLITHLYTADPSAHVFEGKLYIYPSHDRETDETFNDNGDQYDMVDYHVFSTASVDPPAAVVDHGVALRVEDVPWASKQLWAPDAATKDGQYFSCTFPRATTTASSASALPSARGPRDPSWRTRSPSPAATALTRPCWSMTAALRTYTSAVCGAGSCSVTKAVTMCSTTAGPAPRSRRALGSWRWVRAWPRLTADMRQLGEAVREITILAPETGAPIAADDHDRRFFEAAWVHKRNGVYYFSYSTGDTHFLCYATGTSPYGPFTYGGRILEPVVGWTTHHSIVEFGGRWWLFHHDSEMSGGVSHLRSVKVKELWYDDEGRIVSEKPA